MAAARDAGNRVVCVTAMLGEHGTDDPTGRPPDRLGAVRERELQASLAALDVTEHHLLSERAAEDHFNWRRQDCLVCRQRIVRNRHAWIDVVGTRDGSRLTFYGMNPNRQRD